MSFSPSQIASPSAQEWDKMEASLKDLAHSYTFTREESEDDII